MKNVSFLCLLKAKKENLFLIWFCLHFGNEFFKYIVGISVWLMYMYIYVWIKLRWTVIQKNWESWSEIDLASLLLLLTNWSSVMKDAKWRMRGNHCKPNPEVWSCGSFCFNKKKKKINPWFQSVKSAMFYRAKVVVVHYNSVLLTGPVTNIKFKKKKSVF